ncbi:hypothetical protein DO97_06155 [Neosynechococcus sphagnicola sy1]|uniref:Alpha/beta hydrolase n=1 Tax=Neosynechococcus sphagnicola sy1 TaxID=1497020 RepID=A0A098TT19_9CYAN|nr:hypothetical protein [Neosynechococcus sphagnicola]KGF73923.1 hypothetical protein DO97_06155 [Neosynechococcus sphagnicola sy1]
MDSSPLRVVLCPGFHPPELTDQFWQGLAEQVSDMAILPPLCFPAPDYPAYSPLHILAFLHHHLPIAATAPPLVFIGFSAGVVGAIAAANIWQYQGTVRALFALDGWGVPLAAPFPIHRLSHDAFTHWSSVLLGGGDPSFYADPAVPHLDLWRSPQTTIGWWISRSGDRGATTAAQFLGQWLRQYGNQAQPAP